MARLFISHSSLNNNKAIEVRDWLAKNGWDDVFLDLDPERSALGEEAIGRCKAAAILVGKHGIGNTHQTGNAKICKRPGSHSTGTVQRLGLDVVAFDF
jgi:hypothetical protein